MIYVPKILENKTGKMVEFTCGGVLYQIGHGERLSFEGFVAHHALNVANTGLKEAGDKTPEKITQDMEVDKLSWRQLQKLAGKDYRMGMNKRDVVQILKSRQEG